MKHVGLKELSVRDVRENDYNPRKRFDDAAFRELVESIRRVGLIQPVVVRPVDGGHEVVVGVRRYRALKELGSKAILTNIIEAGDKEARILSLTENLARDELTPIEEARAYAEYLGVTELSSEKTQVPGGEKAVKELGQQIGVDASVIYKRIGLLALPADLQAKVEENSLSITHAEIISRLRRVEDESLRSQKMRELAVRVDRLTDSQLREEVKRTLESVNKQRKRDTDILEEYRKNYADKERTLASTVKSASSWTKGNVDQEWLAKQGLSIPGGEEDLQGQGEGLNMVLKGWQDRLQGEEYKLLTQQGIAVEEEMTRVRQAVELIEKIGPEGDIYKCPWCLGLTRPSKLRTELETFQGQLEGFQEKKAELSEEATEVEKISRGLLADVREYRSAGELLAKQLEQMGRPEEVGV